MQQILQIQCCPRCGEPLNICQTIQGRHKEIWWYCTNAECNYNTSYQAVH